jgi:hypothetical protein
MSKDPANLEKALAKKARKQAKKEELRAKKARIAGVFAPEVLSTKGAENWELSTCWIASDWRNTNNLTQAIVTRTHANGRVAVTAFIVDLACLGVKNASVAAFISDYEFRFEYLDRVQQTQAFETCSSDLIAKIVRTGIDYARSLGFEPHRDTKDALKFLHDAHPETVLDAIPTGGENGRPLFVQGPYDNVNKIIRTLEKTVGEGNFDFVSKEDIFGDHEDEFYADDDEIDVDAVMDLLETLDDDEVEALVEKAEREAKSQRDAKIIDVKAKTLE